MGYKARLTAEKYPIEQAAEEFMKSISGLIPYTKEFISKTT